jgi:hypothetical protein
MKLCPQCDFIYEDEQVFCDMDGKELVRERPSKLTIPLDVPAAPAPAVAAQPSSSNGMLLVSVVLLVLAAIVVGVYFARSRQVGGTQSVNSAQPATEKRSQPTGQAVQPQNTVAPQTDTATNQDQTSLNADAAATPLSAASGKVSLAHTRVNAGPIAASSSNSQGLVIVRLTNGAAIRADEAWEKREGVWYRQAGMVTFLKRSQVRSIERVSAQPQRVQTRTNDLKDARHTRDGDRLRIARLEPAKKPSRVSSFLKKTGQLIKKPFKF